MTPELVRWQTRFMTDLAAFGAMTKLFDRLPDIVFSIKDRQGCYVSISAEATHRCGLRHSSHAVGQTAFDLFPAPMAERYKRQDERLFHSGRPIIDSLDLTIYRDGSSGWCVTSKEPLHNKQQQIVGLICISRDLVEYNRRGLIDEDFVAAIDYLHEHFREPLRVEELARRSQLSLPRFERRMKKIFHLSPGQYLIKTRIDHAMRMLTSSDCAIAEVAQESGFQDQSALSRQFRQLTGFTPRQYRQLLYDQS